MGQPVRRLALANAGLGVVHGLAGPLGGLSDASHGALCGCLLPFGLELNESQVTNPALRQRFLDVRQWIAAGLGVSPDDAGKACANGASAQGSAIYATSAYRAKRWNPPRWRPVVHRR